MKMNLEISRIARWLVVLLLFVLFPGATTVFASEQFCLEPAAIFQDSDAYPWERVERLVDKHPGFKQEVFAPGGQQLDPRVKKWFGGTGTPHSGLVLLHCAPGFMKKTFPVPVLLIHGAGDNANRAWIHPFDAVMPEKLAKEKAGFALQLANLGYSVFALTFSHNQGCNIMQSEQASNAILRIRKILNREKDPNFKVDIIAHSKGNVAVRLYCSDSRSIFPKKNFLSRYRNDVRKYIALAAPMRGIDAPFRYYGYQLMLASMDQAKLNAPYGAVGFLFYGLWKNVTPYSVYANSKGYFPGQNQLLYNLVRDADIPLGMESATMDFNQTGHILYHGGTSMFLSSPGIDKAIADGERLIYALEGKGIDPRISLGVLAGGNPLLSCHVPGLGYIPMAHEIISAPFDGLLYVDSATYTDGILRRGAKLLGKKVLDLNHIRIAMFPEAFKIIDEWLLKPVR